MYSLQEALDHFGVVLDAEVVSQLDQYRKALWEWNEMLNLTRHTTFEKFVSRDIVDSLELAKLIDQGDRVLDIGTGGGVPGVVMAICRKDLKVSVCESTEKKAHAVYDIVGRLSLPVRVHACRAEEVLELQTFDTLVARAVAPLGKILRFLQPHWGSFDRLLAIKGRSWVEERREARHRGMMGNIELRKASTYLIPGTDGESVVLKLWNKDLSADAYGEG